jgi:hypothetical protein
MIDVGYEKMPFMNEIEMYLDISHCEVSCDTFSRIGCIGESTSRWESISSRLMSVKSVYTAAWNVLVEANLCPRRGESCSHFACASEVAIHIGEFTWSSIRLTTKVYEIAR